MSEAPNGIVPFVVSIVFLTEEPVGIVPLVPTRALVSVPAIFDQVTDPQVLSGLIHDGEWRTAAEWRDLRAALQLRRCGEDATLEARLILDR